MEKTDKERLADERSERAKKNVAKAINLLETGNQDLKWACESMGWNDEVTFQISEAVERLGMALATLVNWDDAAEEP